MLFLGYDFNISITYFTTKNTFLPFFVLLDSTFRFFMLTSYKTQIDHPLQKCFSLMSDKGRVHVLLPICNYICSTSDIHKGNAVMDAMYSV